MKWFFEKVIVPVVGLAIMILIAIIHSPEVAAIFGIK